MVLTRFAVAFGSAYAKQPQIDFRLTILHNNHDPSGFVNGIPIPWSAPSGMAAVPGRRDTLLAVWDSYYAESNFLRIDASAKPAVITESLTIRGATGNYDPEGIAIAPDHTLWIASEGNASDARPNRLLQTDRAGNVIR